MNALYLSAGFVLAVGFVLGCIFCIIYSVFFSRAGKALIREDEINENLNLQILGLQEDLDKASQRLEVSKNQALVRESELKENLNTLRQELSQAQKILREGLGTIYDFYTKEDFTKNCNEGEIALKLCQDHLGLKFSKAKILNRKWIGSSPFNSNCGWHISTKYTIEFWVEPKLPNFEDDQQATEPVTVRKVEKVTKLLAETN